MVGECRRRRRGSCTSNEVVRLVGSPGGDYDLFLDSRGYYLEWMRQEWLREQNPLAALRMLLDPARALRELAPAFKRIEPQAETLFWRSRYAHP